MRRETRALMTTPADVIDRQLAAYNRRDLDGFVGCYAADAEIVQPDQSLLASGHDEIRARYGELFDSSPDLRAEIRNRIEIGSVVIDHEAITGFVLPGMPSELQAAVVYQVADELIHKARLFG
jgi:putative hydrolase of HD superfamily